MKRSRWLRGLLLLALYFCSLALGACSNAPTQAERERASKLKWIMIGTEKDFQLVKDCTYLGRYDCSRDLDARVVSLFPAANTVTIVNEGKTTSMMYGEYIVRSCSAFRCKAPK